MRRIVQIAPDIGPGSGVGAVAYNLELEWRRRGIKTERFTMHEAHGNWLPGPGPGIRGKIALALRVVWFSTVGTLLARRYLRRSPDTVSICHNDALTGDIYVNHGLLRTSMRARGHYAWRMLRNPLHLFTGLRDTLRYSTSTHRVVVNLTEGELPLLHRMYPHLKPRAVLIPNGVDLEHFHVPTPQERATARAQLGFGEKETVVLFVGHEFERKGLPVLMSALAGTPETFHLIVVGGTSDMLKGAHEAAVEWGIERRIHLVGRVSDAAPYFHASDVFALLSAYESFGLVILEALACGVPVVTTATGCAGDVINDGLNGYIVAPRTEQIQQSLLAIEEGNRSELARAARKSAEAYSWTMVAERYLGIIDEIGAPTLPLQSRS